MADDPLDPVQPDGDLSDERVSQLLGLQAEGPKLDYKETFDLSVTKDLVELTKDIGAMGVAGGYIIGGADNHGRLTGGLDGVDPRPYDEANLRPKLRKWLPTTATFRSRILELDGHTVVAICVLPSSQGCSVFIADGTYRDERGNDKTVFTKGDVFWRDGTSSARISPEGLERVLDQRVAAAKSSWMAEQDQIRRRDREELQRNFEARQLGQGPLGSVHFGLPAEEITRAALDLLRNGDRVALLHLLREGVSRAKGSAFAGTADDEFLDILDKLTCLAATFIEYEAHDWLVRAIDALVEIYGSAFRGQNPRIYGYQAHIPPTDPGPRIWLEIVERVFALGGLAVRRGDWRSVRLLALQLPDPLRQDGHDKNWLRHAVTMASRAEHIGKNDPQDPTKLVSLIVLARRDATRLACLTPDGVSADAEALLTSLVQFDALSNVAAIGDAQTTDGRIFYSNFARFRQDRIQPIVNQLLVDEAMRSELFPLGNADLATALRMIGERAAQEGWMSDGFRGWDGTAVGEFIQAHHPPPEPATPAS